MSLWATARHRDEEIREYQAALRSTPTMPKRTTTWAWPTGDRAAPMRRSGSSRRRCGSTPTMLQAHYHPGQSLTGNRAAPMRRCGSTRRRCGSIPMLTRSLQPGGALRATGPHRRGDPGVPGGAADQPRPCRSALQPGRSLRTKGRLDEAIREYQAALRINPTCQSALPPGRGLLATGSPGRGNPGIPSGAADQPQRCRSASQPGRSLLAPGPHR